MTVLSFASATNMTSCNRDANIGAICPRAGHSLASAVAFARSLAVACVRPTEALKEAAKEYGCAGW